MREHPDADVECCKVSITIMKKEQSEDEKKRKIQVSLAGTSMNETPSKQAKLEVLVSLL